MNSASFDPYHEWLGIRPDQRPIDHYQLLNLTPFESDPDVIRQAADRGMSHVRTFQYGPRAQASQQLLNELAAAKVCLLDPQTKASYDADLREQLARQAAAPPMGPPPPPVTAPPIAAPAAPPVTGPPIPAPPLSEPASLSSSPEETVEERPVPFYVEPWFPVMVIAGVMLLGLGVWALVLAMQAGEEMQETAARPATVTANHDNVPATDDSDEDDAVDDAVVIRPEASGQLNLSAATAEVEGGPRLVTRDGTNLIMGITSLEDRLSWVFEIEEPSAFRIEATYATTAESAGGEFVLATEEEQTKTLSTRETGGPASFTSERIGFIWLRRSGRHRLTLTPTSIPAGQSLMTLEMVRLVPVAGTITPE